MAVRALTEPLTVWRIGDPEGRWPIYSADGAIRNDGRWHRKGQAVIYTSEHYGTALLEKLVHYNGVLPPNQHFITIDLPVGTSYEVVTRDSLPGWDDENQLVSRAYGSHWIDKKRSAILIVPSVPAREENNVIINPGHPDSGSAKPDLEKPVRWDNRLFSE